MSSSSGSIQSMSPPNMSPQRNVIQITAEQWDALEAQFAKVKNPHPTDLVLLAAEIGLDESDVQAWYTQRIAAWRRSQGLTPYSGRVD
ncbi:homeodomain-only protein-like [Cloeon dipterum]|uniref:homeodomain-only protein-like n=1 Tax=Cloeon dipterum TaxID=197152 RepID=UPI00321F9AE1